MDFSFSVSFVKQTNCIFHVMLLKLGLLKINIVEIHVCKIDKWEKRHETEIDLSSKLEFLQNKQ
jgi:hypothetical protein